MQRRDIFDPATVSGFAATVGNQERLQRLCLLTYADIHAVNPEALTPWKADMLWQLFVATSNHFSRTLDRDRVHAPDETSLLEQVRGVLAGGTTEEIERFLEGLPRRYLAVHSANDIAQHIAMYRKLKAEPVQIELRPSGRAFSLTLMTADRPSLFATIAGVLAGWGMNIIKADAFANAAGTVVDTFHFADLHRTLELNPTEIDRFRRSLADVVNGKAPLQPLLQGRDKASRERPPKVAIETKFGFDDNSSEHSTLLEIVATGSAGLALRHRINAGAALVQHRSRVDRYRRTESHRRLLSYRAGQKARCRETSSAFRGAPRKAGIGLQLLFRVNTSRYHRSRRSFPSLIRIEQLGQSTCE